ncbi:MAG: hypothetical protein BHV67_16465 [Bacteroidales bacterium 43_36]|nr:MAG: hypothetical protein BHV67_16465 [Bacteroidales bacterium 43_36]
MAEKSLTLQSSNEELKAYFEAVCKIVDSNCDEFPINLDEVWPLCYARRDYATDALKKDFIENVDYNITSVKTEVGSIRHEYYLTTSCFEFFIARKVRPVFEVYRQVFHAARQGELRPRELSRKELALMVIQAEEEKERLMIENKAQADKIAEDAPKVEFHDMVTASTDTCLIRELAKVLTQRGFKIGQNRLYEILRNEGYLIKSGSDRNSPRQEYVTSGLFEVDRKPWKDAQGQQHIGKTSKVTPKGIKYFVRKFLGKAAVL